MLRVANVVVAGKTKAMEGKGCGYAGQHKLRPRQGSEVVRLALLILGAAIQRYRDVEWMPDRQS